MVEDKDSMWEGALRAKQVELHRSSIPIAIGAAAVTAALMATMLWGPVTPLVLTYWLAALLLAFALRVGTLAWHRKTSSAPAPDRVWLLRYRITLFVHGVVWGLASMLPLAPGNAVQQAILVFVLVGVAVGGALFAAADLAGALLFGLPVLLLLSSQLLSRADHGLWVLGITSAITVILTSAMAYRVHRAWRLHESLRLAEAAQAARLRGSEDLLERTGAMAGVGGWQLDTATMSLRLTAHAFHIHGSPPAARATFDGFVGLYAPEQQAIIRAGLADVVANGSSYDRQLPLTTHAGEQRWIRLSGRPESRDGKVVQIAGVVQDVTEAKAAERALAEQHHLLQLLVRTTSDGFWFIDAAGITTDANPAMCRIAGRPRDAMVGSRVVEFLDAENAAVFHEQMRLRAEGAIGRYELVLIRGDGSPVQCAVNGTPIIDSAGRYAGSIGMWIDITARKEAERALIAAKNEAERANRAKSQFLSSMSHELRTPMNAILGFGQLLGSDQVNPLAERQREHVREIMRGARHLLSLINEVLDLTLVETGKLRLSMEPVQMRALLDECLALMHPLGRERGIELGVVDGSNCDAFVLADRTRLKQVLLNLLSNAIKYNREHGDVRIACTREGDSVRLDVTDSGPGIGDDEATRLFQPFERLDAARTHVEGAGLGLVLSRQLLEAMGGQIGVASGAGRGSTFWIRLPQVESPAHTAPEASPAVTQFGNTAHGVQRKVLYIEDNPVNVLLMEAMLERLPGLTMVSAPLPAIGLQMAIDEHPDLILLDIQLPGMDGFEVLRRLRLQPASRDLPVIAVSANAMPGDVESGLSAGFVRYLTKPLDMNALHAAVDAALAPG